MIILTILCQVLCFPQRTLAELPLTSPRYKALVVNCSVLPHTRISDTCVKKECSISKVENLRAQISHLVSNIAAEFEILQVSDVYVLLLGGSMCFLPCLTNKISSPLSCFCGMNLRLKRGWLM